VNSRTAKATQRNPVSKNQEKEKEKEKKKKKTKQTKKKKPLEEQSVLLTTESSLLPPSFN